MYYFKSGQSKKAKAFLRSCSMIHDGEFQQAIYNQKQKKFTVHVSNMFFNSAISMVFGNIRQFVCISDYMWGKDESINCLAVIDNPKDLPDFMHVAEGEDDLCFVWEMFSGNLIYIVCTELQISCSIEDESGSTP